MKMQTKHTLINSSNWKFKFQVGIRAGNRSDHRPLPSATIHHCPPPAAASHHIFRRTQGWVHLEERDSPLQVAWPESQPRAAVRPLKACRTSPKRLVVFFWARFSPCFSLFFPTHASSSSTPLGFLFPLIENGIHWPCVILLWNSHHYYYKTQLKELFVLVCLSGVVVPWPRISWPLGKRS